MLHPLLTSLAAVLVSHVVVLSAVLALVAALDPTEMTAAPDLEALIPRLRSRAADPERRTDVRPSELGATVATLDLGGLLAMGRDLGRACTTSSRRTRRGASTRPATPGPWSSSARCRRRRPSVLPAPAAEAMVAGPRPTSASRSRSPSAASTGGRRRRVRSRPGLLPLTRRRRGRSATSAGRMAGCPAVGRGRPGCCRWSSWTRASTAVEAATGRVIAWDPEGLPSMRARTGSGARSARSSRASRRGSATGSARRRRPSSPRT